MAPELLTLEQSDYDAYKTDIYSAGIVLYVMLFNEFPFCGADMVCLHQSYIIITLWLMMVNISQVDDKELYIDMLRSLKEHVVLRYEDNDNVSESAKSLIERIIQGEADKRITFEQMLASKWMTN